MTEMKEQNKAPDQELNKMEISISLRVQNTGYKDAQEAQWALQQHKNDPIRNEVNTD